MLVRRRVEDQLRPVRVEDRADALRVAHAAYERHQVEIRVVVPQLLLDGVGVVLVDVEDDELLGVVARDLAAELGSDGAAAPGDHDNAALDETAHLLRVHHDGVAAQQVLQADFAQLAHGHLAVHELVDARYRADLAPCGAAQLQDLPAVGAAAAGDGKDDLVHAVLVAGPGDRVAAAHDGHALKVAAVLAGVVVHRADHPHAQLRAHGNLADQGAAALAGPHHQDALGLCVSAEPAAQQAHEAPGETHARCGGEAQEATSQPVRHGHAHTHGERQERQRRGVHRPGGDEPAQLAHRGEAPDAVVQAQRPERGHHQADGRGHQGFVPVEQLLWDLAPHQVEAQKQRHKEGRRHADGVENRDDGGALRPLGVHPQERAVPMCLII